MFFLRKSAYYSKVFVGAILLLLSIIVTADEPRVYLLEPQDGQELTNPITVKFGLIGMGVAPAGVDQDNTGHHHLLIDVATLPELTQPLPLSEHIRHFGKGQTETALTLTPGQHTLQLVLGDYMHVPRAGMISDKITITVK